MNLSARPVVQWTMVAALLALYYTLALSAAAHKSMTFDEMAHLTGGYSYWAFNDYRLHPENGNWPQRLAALPAVIGGAAFPRLEQPAWRNSNVYAIGDQFLYSTGNDADTLLRRGRAVMGLLAVALGALVFAWTQRLLSPSAAWVSRPRQRKSRCSTSRTIRRVNCTTTSTRPSRPTGRRRPATM
jgi:hypothetical protein